MKKTANPKKSPDRKLPDLQDQFPSDPNRAAELGMTYGEGAPELSGKRAEPKATVTTVDRHARANAGPTPQQATKKAKEKSAEKNLEQAQEKIGRRGRYG
jgi:hypothetical protein